MAFNDDWLVFTLNELLSTNNPPPNNIFGQSLINIPLDDAGGSPVPDLSYNNDLAVPLEYLGNELRLSHGPNQPGTSDGYNVDNSMHLRQNSSNFDSQMQPSTSGVEYNSFEMPQVVAVDGGDMDNAHFDLGSELTVNNAFYSNQQLSTSGQLTDSSDQTVNLHNHNQLINENGQYMPQAEVILHQMEPSTSYAQQARMTSEESSRLHQGLEELKSLYREDIDIPTNLQYLSESEREPQVENEPESVSDSESAREPESESDAESEREPDSESDSESDRERDQEREEEHQSNTSSDDEELERMAQEVERLVNAEWHVHIQICIIRLI